MEKIIEGEHITENKEIAVIEKPSANLIIGEDSVAKASKVAIALADVVERQKLYVDIQKKKYVMVEGWNTLGALMGVFPEVVSVEKLPTRIVKMFFCKITKFDFYKKTNYTVSTLVNPALFDPTDTKVVKLEERDFEEIAYKAVVRLKTADGKEISQAEALCSNLEESKYKNDEYAINSMAQTRASGKAFRLAFSWIIKMAGYEATPAEEMPRDGFADNDATVAPNKTTDAFHKACGLPSTDEPPLPEEYGGEPTYEPVEAEKEVDKRQPWKKWTPKANGSTTFLCQSCMAVITQAEDGYSRRFWGKPLCRACQKIEPKIN